MYYRINVAHKTGGHYFATAEHSITDQHKAKRTLEDFRNRFPDSEGWKITCTYWQTIGHDQDFNEE